MRFRATPPSLTEGPGGQPEPHPTAFAEQPIA